MQYKMVQTGRRYIDCYKYDGLNGRHDGIGQVGEAGELGLVKADAEAATVGSGTPLNLKPVLIQAGEIVGG
jgi:hypothetical protein